MFADGEKMGTQQSYVERKHDFPGTVTSFFLYLFTGLPLSLSPERDNGNTIINFRFEIVYWFYLKRSGKNLCNLGTMTKIYVHFLPL